MLLIQQPKNITIRFSKFIIRSAGIAVRLSMSAVRPVEAAVRCSMFAVRPVETVIRYSMFAVRCAEIARADSGTVPIQTKTARAKRLNALISAENIVIPSR